MKVRIIKASKDTYWYARYIGEVFEVEPHNSIEYWYSDGKGSCIFGGDCEIVPELPTLTPFTLAAWDKDRSQKVFTRDGREVKQLTYFEGLEPYCFRGILPNGLNSWNKNGYFHTSQNGNDANLFLEHTEKEYWVNVYEDKCYGGVLTGKTHNSFESAVDKKESYYIKTISFKA